MLFDPAAAEDAASEIRASADQLPALLIGGVIVYLLSTLEVTLAECSATARTVLGLPSLTNPPRTNKIENYRRDLAKCGVNVQWDTGLWDQLR